MKNIKWFLLTVIVILCSLFLLNGCKPVRNMTSAPRSWSGDKPIAKSRVVYDSTKKTVFIVADYKLTELFDMLAPYYLFNETGKANVYIVAVNNTPILVRRDMYVKPQFTFIDIDSLAIKPDVIVIPALSARGKDQNPKLIDFIKRHYTANTKVLAVCDGAATAAATGLYNGKDITCHASDIAGIRSNFQEPVWIQNVSVTNSGNLYSTAGVSNAVEGSLTVINDLFGKEVMHEVKERVHYPHPDIQLNHRSVGVNGRHKRTAFKKIFFRKNKDLAVVVQDGVNEFELAAVMDTYGRTFPASLTPYIMNDSVVETKHGLSLIFTGAKDPKSLDELHVLAPDSFSNNDAAMFSHAKIIRYSNFRSEYPFNTCLKQIRKDYGKSFEELVKVSLDYN